MTQRPRVPALNRYAWFVLRFILVSAGLLLLWPLFAPGYVRLVGFLMVLPLRMMGFDTQLSEGPSGSLQFDIIYGSARGLVTPLQDPRSILLNMITLIALFSGALFPPRPRPLARLGLAMVILLLFQTMVGVLMTVQALPAFADNASLTGVSDVVLASRSLVPILLWLSLDPGPRAYLAARLARLSSGPLPDPARPVPGRAEAR